MKLLVDNKELTLLDESTITIEKSNSAISENGTFSIPITLPRQDNVQVLGHPGRLYRRGDLPEKTFKLKSGSSEILTGAIEYGDVTNDNVEINMVSDEKYFEKFYSGKFLDEVYYDPLEIEDDYFKRVSRERSGGELEKYEFFTSGSILTFHRINREALNGIITPFVVAPFLCNAIISKEDGEETTEETKTMVINAITAKSETGDGIEWPTGKFENYKTPPISPARGAAGENRRANSYNSENYRFLPGKDSPGVEYVGEEATYKGEKHMCLQWRICWLFEQLLKHTGWVVTRNDLSNHPFYKDLIIYGRLFDGYIPKQQDMHFPNESNIGGLMPHYDVLGFIENVKKLTGMGIYFNYRKNEVEIINRNYGLDLKTVSNLFNTRKLDDFVFSEPKNRTGYVFKFKQQPDNSDYSDDYVFNYIMKIETFEELGSPEIVGLIHGLNLRYNRIKRFIVYVIERDKYYYRKKILDEDEKTSYVWREYARLMPISSNMKPKKAYYEYSPDVEIKFIEDTGEVIELDFVIPEMKQCWDFDKAKGLSDYDFENYWEWGSHEDSIFDEMIMPYINAEADDISTNLYLSKFTVGLNLLTAKGFSYLLKENIPGLITQRYFFDGSDIFTRDTSPVAAELKLWNNKLYDENIELTPKYFHSTQERFFEFLFYNSVDATINVDLTASESLGLEQWRFFLFGGDLYYIKKSETEIMTDGATNIKLYCLAMRNNEDNIPNLIEPNTNVTRNVGDRAPR